MNNDAPAPNKSAGKLMITYTTARWRSVPPHCTEKNIYFCSFFVFVCVIIVIEKFQVSDHSNEKRMFKKKKLWE